MTKSSNITDKLTCINSQIFELLIQSKVFSSAVIIKDEFENHPVGFNTCGSSSRSSSSL